MTTANSDAHRWANHSSFLFMTISAFLALNSPAWGQYSKYQSIEDAIYNNQLHKGLITTIVEIAHNQFEIQQEELCTDPLDSRIIVIYLDKTKQILTLEEALALIQQQDWVAAQDTALHTVSNNLLDRNHTFHKNYNSSMHSLGYVIIGGTVGYYLGKSKQLPPNPNVYTSPPTQYFFNRQNYPPSSRTTYNYQPHNNSKTGTNSNKVTNNNRTTTSSNNNRTATSSNNNKTTTSSNNNRTTTSSSNNRTTTPHRSTHSTYNSNSNDDYSSDSDGNDNNGHYHSVPNGHSGYFKSSSSSSSSRSSGSNSSSSSSSSSRSSSSHSG